MYPLSLQTSILFETNEAVLQLTLICMKFNHVTDIYTHTTAWKDVIVWRPYKYFHFDSSASYFSLGLKYLASPAFWESFLRKQGTFNHKYSFSHEFLTGREAWPFPEIFMEVTEVNSEEAILLAPMQILKPWA